MYYQNRTQLTTRRNGQGGINRVITAAVVSRTFRELLLKDPNQALDQGYNSESFCLQDDERERILAINARSVSDLASQLARAFTSNGTS